MKVGWNTYAMSTQLEVAGVTWASEPQLGGRLVKSGMGGTSTAAETPTAATATATSSSTRLKEAIGADERGWCKRKLFDVRTGNRSAGNV